MTKTIGAVLKRFYDDETAWPDGAWHEDELLLVNGDEWDQGITEIPDNAIVNISGGAVFGLPNGGEPSLELHFRRWRLRQTTTTILVECDLAKLDAIKAAIKAAGGTVGGGAA